MRVSSHSAGRLGADLPCSATPCELEKRSIGMLMITSQEREMRGAAKGPWSIEWLDNKKADEIHSR